MKQIFQGFGLAAGLLLFMGSAPSSRVEFGKITLPLGQVEVAEAGSSAWTRVLPNRPVYIQDKIRTLAKSRCEIALAGGGKVRIGENSELELTEASVKPLQKDFGANLNSGNVWVSAKAAFGEKKNVSIRTPTAVAAIRGTVYRAKAGSEESSVLVYSGKVDVNQPANLDQQKEAPGQPPDIKPKFKLSPPQQIQAPTQVAGPYEVSLEDWISLVEGMQINVRKDGKYNLFKFDQTADAELDFVKWNRELDSE